MADYRDELQALVAAFDEHGGKWPQESEDALHATVARARALLDQPVAEGPTDEELLAMRSWSSHSHTFDSDLVDFGRAVLARWGRPTPQPSTDKEVVEVLQWPAEWSRWQRAQEAEMLCRSAGMTPGKEMQQIVRDARDGVPLQHLHDLISHAIPTPQPLPDNYIDPGHTDRDRELLEIFYVACQSEGGTADEIHLRGIRAVMPQPPVAGEVAELAKCLSDSLQAFCLTQQPSDYPIDHWSRRAADLLQRQHPQPVAVSERLPGPEDCLVRPTEESDAGWC